MRDIEFRGQCIDSGEWFYGYYFKGNNDDCHIISTKKNDIGLTQTIRVKTETVGQYTGIPDAEKERIFEGDICDYEYWIQTSVDPDSEGRQFFGVGVVVFIDGAFMIEDVKTKLRVPFHYTELTMTLRGNKTDNPELLEA